MTTSPNDPAPTTTEPAPTTPPTPDPQQQMATTMEKFVAAFIAEFSETPKPAALSDEYLAAWFTASQVDGTRTPGDMVSRAAATLVEHRKRYPKAA